MSVKSQKGSTRYFILLIAALILIWTVYQEFKPHQEVGRMEYRMLTGIKDNSIEVILVETSKQYTVMDEDFKDIIQNNDAEIISRPEQLRLLQTYKDLEYRVSIYQNIKEETAQFRLSRENFNAIRFDADIKFEIDRKVRDSIVSIVEM